MGGNGAGLKIIEEEVSRGDYHSLRLFCAWGAYICGTLTYLCLKRMEGPGNPVADTISDLKAGVVPGQVVTAGLAVIFLLLWGILIRKSKNLLEEIEDNCHMSIFAGVVAAIVLGVCTYAVYSTPKYAGSRPAILVLDFLGGSSPVIGVVGLVAVKLRRRRKK